MGQSTSRDNVRPLLLPGEADLIPVEILCEIFLITLQGRLWYRRDLILVCRRWRAIILEMPSIPSQLTIRRATQKKVVQAFVHGRKSRLDVRVDMNNEKDGSGFNTKDFHACFMAASQEASRWSSLNLVSPPPHGEYESLQILQPLTHLESFKVACGFGESLEPLMTAISGGASPNLTTICLQDPAAILYLVQPACLHINHSLTTLTIQLSKKMDSPVDILPHLHSLKEFEARNLCLPFYPPDASLPLTHTLFSLDLKSVSVQWMAGHIFPGLMFCKVKFPHHADTIQAFQPVNMPMCLNFLYHANDLHPLAHFHLPFIGGLDVKSGQWNVWRGNPQVAALCPVFSADITELRLDVECSERLLVYMLSLVPALKQLWLGLARPNALSTRFFRAFIIREPKADGASDMVGTRRQAIAPLCPSLESFDLHYRRWLRSLDKKALIVAFGDVMRSRNLEINGSFNLILSFGEVLQSRWSIDTSVRKSQDVAHAGITLGISVPHGMIPISTLVTPDGVVALPCEEAEYLHLQQPILYSPLSCLFTHDHIELKVYGHDQLPPPTSLPCAFPLFSALRVLVVEGVNPSFFAGHTFHKLERCRVLKSRNPFGASPSLFIEAGMPVCTRLDIFDPYLLATFKLPKIHELALNFPDPNYSTFGEIRPTVNANVSDPDCSTIWEKRITVNAKLSGLTLLHIKNWPRDGDLIPILRSLSLLETLVISSRVGEVSFGAFLPMDANETSGLKETSVEGRALSLLCPRLQSLRIEGQDPSVEPGLISILKDIVTLRAELASPLKSFTFSMFRPKPGSLFELVRTNGSFMIERIDLPDEARKFELDIEFV
jgi:hypothetical protein